MRSCGRELQVRHAPPQAPPQTHPLRSPGPRPCDLHFNKSVPCPLVIRCQPEAPGVWDTLGWSPAAGCSRSNVAGLSGQVTLKDDTRHGEGQGKGLRGKGQGQEGG